MFATDETASRRAYVCVIYGRCMAGTAGSKLLDVCYKSRSYPGKENNEIKRCRSEYKREKMI